MTIKTRVLKAREQATKVTVDKYPFNDFTSSYACRSLSDETVNYQMTLRYSADLKKNKLTIFNLEDVSFPQINTVCQQVTGHGMEGCKGNERTICRHSMAAIIVKASKKKATVTFFDDFSPALNYSNFGGILVRVVSTQAGKVGWIVVKSNLQPSFISIDEEITGDYDIGKTFSIVQSKINLMRGPVEEGIK